MTAYTTEKADRTLTGGRNCSIDIFRCVCALLVIINHADPLWDMELTMLRRIKTPVTNLAIAFFSMTAGFFFFRGLMKGKKPLLPYLKRLFIPYAIWSVLYFGIEFLSGDRSNILGFLKVSVIRFLISGSVYHFWYFPAMMVSAIIAAAFFRLRAGKVLLPLLSFAMFALLVILKDYSWLFTGVSGAFAALADDRMIAIQRMFFLAFPYFCAGYSVRLLTEKDNFLRRNSGAVLAVCAFLFALEFILLVSLGVRALNVMFSQYFLCASLLLFLNEHPMSGMEEAANRCRVFAGLSYYVHPALIMVVDALYAFAFNAATPSLLRFAVVCVLCVLLSAAVMRINNKYLNMITS